MRLNKVVKNINVTINETDRPESKQESKKKMNQWNNFSKKKQKMKMK
jgi:hypothetical protein